MAKIGFSAILLAAGKGTRMKSPLPKVLHPVAGLPMIQRVVTEVKRAGAKEIRAVLGFGESLVKSVVEPLGVCCFHQKEQRGTGDAVRAAQPESLDGVVLIMNGDHPLVQAEELRRLVVEFEKSGDDLRVVTAVLKNPTGFGRVLRRQGQVCAIIEEKDASFETKKISEINTGIYLIRAKTLQTLLPQLKNENAQGEYYLTDIVALGLEGRASVGAVKAPLRFAFGVNSQAELAKASQIIFREKARQLMDQGVVMIDPRSTYIEDPVQIGPGSVIYPGVTIKGPSQLGSCCVVEPQAMLIRCELGNGVEVKAGTYIQEAKIGDQVQLGPYAHIRPGTKIGSEAKVGNFVELKNAQLAERVKASHLSYLGDAEIGEDTNIGCGTITCNYAVDRKKYRTKIGKNVFVGSDSQFVAPVVIGDGAIIASGSTITEDVASGALAVARSRQVVKENYQGLKSGVAPQSSSIHSDREKKLVASSEIHEPVASEVTQEPDKE